MKTLRVVLYLVLLFLLLLLAYNLAYARPLDMSLGEWAEFKREESVKPVKIVEKSVESVKIVEVSDPECVVRVIEDWLYFVESRCLTGALTAIPNPAGNALYCGYEGLFASPGEYAIFSAPLGQNGKLGFYYCSEIDG